MVAVGIHIANIMIFYFVVDTQTACAVRGLMKQMCEENHSPETLKILIMWEGYRWLNKLLVFSVRCWCSYLATEMNQTANCPTGRQGISADERSLLGRKLSIIKKTPLNLLYVLMLVRSWGQHFFYTHHLRQRGAEWKLINWTPRGKRGSVWMMLLLETLRCTKFEI